MNRYQIYLNPQSVNTLDSLADNLDLSRSQLIRDVLDRVSLEYAKVIRAVKKIPLQRHPLMKMAGVIKGVKQPLSENIDQIYLYD